jgi:hypothetical protein
VAFFDRAVPPGGMGKIQIRIRTKGYSGNIRKGAKVYTNDPEWSQASLTLRAFVKPVITLSRSNLNFSGKEGQDIAKEVEIIAGLDRPLTLTPVMFNLDGKITYTLEEIEKGRKFRVRFKSIPGPAGNYRGFLRLRTNYSEKPEVTIWIWGRFTGKG